MKMLHLESFIHFFPRQIFYSHISISPSLGSDLSVSSVWVGLPASGRERRETPALLLQTTALWGSAGSLDTIPPLWAWGLGGRTFPGCMSLPSGSPA